MTTVGIIQSNVISLIEKQPFLILLNAVASIATGLIALGAIKGVAPILYSGIGIESISFIALIIACKNRSQQQKPTLINCPQFSKILNTYLSGSDLLKLMCVCKQFQNSSDIRELLIESNENQWNADCDTSIVNLIMLYYDHYNDPNLERVIFTGHMLHKLFKSSAAKLVKRDKELTASGNGVVHFLINPGIFAIEKMLGNLEEVNHFNRWEISLKKFQLLRYFFRKWLKDLPKDVCHRVADIVLSKLLKKCHFQGACSGITISFALFLIKNQCNLTRLTEFHYKKRNWMMLQAYAKLKSLGLGMFPEGLMCMELLPERIKQAIFPDVISLSLYPSFPGIQGLIQHQKCQFYFDEDTSQILEKLYGEKIRYYRCNIYSPIAKFAILIEKILLVANEGHLTLSFAPEIGVGHVFNISLSGNLYFIWDSNQKSFNFPDRISVDQTCLKITDNREQVAEEFMKCIDKYTDFTTFAELVFISSHEINLQSIQDCLVF